MVPFFLENTLHTRIGMFSLKEKLGFECYMLLSQQFVIHRSNDLKCHGRDFGRIGTENAVLCVIVCMDKDRKCKQCSVYDSDCLSALETRT